MSDLVGSTLGDYRVEALLGTGRTGQVFRATHVRFDAMVALRVFDIRVTGAPEFKARFFQYAQGIGGLIHPHVLRVRESGEDDRRWFVAMDLATGGSAESERPAASTTEWTPSMWSAVGLVRQAAEGIAAGHAAGMTHGNVTLANLTLSEGTAGVRHVRVAGFGLRNLVPVDGVGGSKEEDLFALGEVLYEITTGRPARPRDVAGAGGRAERGAIVPPRRLMPGLPDTLEVIILRCLAREARDRFASCHELASALGDAVASAAGGTTSPALGGTSPAVKRPASLPAPDGRTDVVPVESKTPPPRPEPTLTAGGLSVPCVHVLDGAGNRVDLEYVQHSGLTIGRAPDNDIVLPSPAVSLRHTRIDWDHNRVTVTDLGSASNTRLKGQMLLPQVAQEWGNDQWLQLGPYWLWLERVSESTQIRNKIEVIIEQRGRVLALTPGKPVTCRVTLANQKATIEHVVLSVDGVPEAWVEGASAKRFLPALERRDVDLVVNVPRTPQGLAGTYTVTIRVHSVTDPHSEEGSAVATWTVEPFDASKVLVSPTKASGIQQARYVVALHNDGNRPTTYGITGGDEDKQLECVFSAEGFGSSSRLSIEVPPGSKSSVKLQVHTARRWFGTSTQRAFTVQAAPGEGRADVQAEAFFAHRAVFPVWMMAVAPLLLIGMLLVLPWLFKPQVRTVYVDPLSPQVGDTFAIFWDAPGARRIRVLVNELPVRPDPDAEAGTYAFTGGFQKDTRIKVVGSNLFGEVSKEVTVTLTPRPAPPPAKAPILEASVSPLTVRPGDAVTVRWSATNATRTEFSHRGSVSLSGEYTDHPTENQTYVISAFNAEGVEVKKSFQVQIRTSQVTDKVVRGMVRLAASSPNLKKDTPGFQINQGQYVFFDWSAPNAKKVRIDAPTPIELAGTSGRARRAQLRGKGHYTFKLVAESETGDEVSSQPVEIDVSCSVIQIATKRCNGAPEVRW